MGVILCPFILSLLISLLKLHSEPSTERPEDQRNKVCFVPSEVAYYRYELAYS